MRERVVKGCNVRRFEIQNVERTKWGLTTLVPHDEGIVRCCIGTVSPRHVEVQGLMWVGPIGFVERYNNKVIKRHEAFDAGDQLLYVHIALVPPQNWVQTLAIPSIIFMFQSVEDHSAGMSEKLEK
ncbi:hypothetical protein VNO80_17983 [Phaseolus coccineus]|uniref:Uncharacterized protein n=1 Tax=Phaseolus coccineus TaxID=3886 RepID=A0AAN9MDE0_PHACN